MSIENQEHTPKQPHLSEAVKDTSSEKLIGAKEALKQRLLRAVMKQAMDEIGNPDSIAQKAMADIDAGTTTIPEAVSQLQNRLIAEISRSALESIADSEKTAAEIADSVSIDRQDIQAVIWALRAHITGEVQDAALASLSDPEKTAADISQHVSVDCAEVRQVIEALQRHLTISIREEAVSFFSETEPVANEIKQTIPGTEETISAVRQKVYDILVEDVRKAALSDLADAEQSVEAVRSGMDELPEPVQQISARVKDLLLDEARSRTMDSVSQIDSMVSHVLESLGDNIEGVTETVNRVRNNLIDEIAKRSRESLEDSDAAAESAHMRIGTNPSEVIEAAERLKDKMIREIADRSAQSVREDPDAVLKAMSYVDPSSAPMRRIRDAVKARILNDVLSSAIHEIHGEVGSAATELSAGLTESGVATDVFDAADLEAFVADSEHDQENAEANLLRELEEQIQGVQDLPTIDEPADAHVEETSDDLWQRLDEFDDDSSDDDDGPGGMPPLTDSGDDYPELPEQQGEPSGDDSAIIATEAEAGPAAPEWIENSAAADDHASDDEVYYAYGIAAASGSEYDGPVPHGIDDGRVEAIDYDGLSAYVSVVPASIFVGEALKRNLENVPWLQQNVRKHASIIERLRSRATLLPMPFCTVFESADEVQQLLASNRDQYLEALERVAGKQEWGLRIYRNRQLLEDRVRASDRRLEGAFGSISKGVVGYLRDEMNRIERDGQPDPIQLMTEHCTQRSHESILALAGEGKLNPDRGGQPRAGEDVVLNTAYLVDEQEGGEIRMEAERLQAEYLEMGFRFELTGPWPPYHFIQSEKTGDVVRATQ